MSPDRNEALHVYEWLHGRLVGDGALMALATGGVHPDIVPKEAVGPALVYYLSDPGTDVMEVGSIRILSDAIYTVRADVRGRSYGPLRPILDRVEELLHRSSGTTATIRVETCTRSGMVPPYTSVDYGEVTRHAGGEYRVQASAL
jgi:hypothetical protein